ncbi:hypothetical protein HUU05_03120 [candidate division KSB1 bacterium]|nr:hypothetical protein [candidate division KSB1 bacterium]
MNLDTIQLTFALPEVNQILEALGQMPYSQVYQLIGKIQQQAQSQLQPVPINDPQAHASRNDHPREGN